jgi:general secretion pathway protein D
MTRQSLVRLTTWAVVLSCLFLPFSAQSVQAEEELITMNFEDTDIRVLIKFMSELTQKNFIVDDKIKGKVTVFSPEKITLPEAYNVFQSILDVQGFTLIPAGKAIKILQSSEAKQRGIETLTAKPSFLGERNDEFVTRIVRMEYVDVNEAATLVRPLISKFGNLNPYKPTNTLILTDIKSNLYRIMKIINEIDVKGYHAELYVIPLYFASVKTVTEHLNKILEQGTVRAPAAPARQRGRAPQQAAVTAGDVSTSARIISDERTNSLIILATRTDYETIINLVRKLDVEAPEGKGRINIYYLQNAVAEEIVSVLQEFITGIKQDQKAAPGQAKLPTETDIKIVADKATNSLIINADPEDYEQIKSVIQKLDIPRSQVLIEALFMEVRGTDSMSLGVEWEAFGGEVGTDNSIDKLGFGGSLTGGGNLPRVIDSINEREVPVNLGTGFNLGVFGNFIEVDGLEFPSISALITAVATRGDTNILATPQILTMDNEEAEIKVGENRPFLTQARTGEQGVNDVFQSFDFRDVGLTLKVTPHISQNRTVRLELFQEISRVNEEATTGPGGTGATAPVTTKRSADTTVVVKDGHTIVIGGLIEDDVTDSDTKVPCLGDLPFLGYLFRSGTNSTGKTNLMIFLTPHIVTNPVEAAELSEGKLETFEDFKRYEMREPELHFHGPDEGPGTGERELPPKLRKPELLPDRTREIGPQSLSVPNGDAPTDAAGRADTGATAETVRSTEPPAAPMTGSSAIPTGLGGASTELPDPAVIEQKKKEAIALLQDLTRPSRSAAAPSAVPAEPQTVARRTAPQRPSYLVRAGVYFGTRHLRKLESRLSDLGYSPVTITKTVMRNQNSLRVGPLRGESDFEKIAAEARAQNADIEKVRDGANLYIQMIFSKAPEALDPMAGRLNRQGYPVSIENHPYPKTIYWLVVGDYASREEASQVQQALQRTNIESMILEKREPAY